jgi:hypothetical protein
MYRRESTIVCMLFGALGCATSEVEVPGPAPGEASAETFKQRVAVHAAAALSDAATRGAVLAELRARGPIALTELPALAKLDDGSAGRGAVPEVWLQDTAAAGDGADLVIAYAPAGGERSWTEIPAYTLDGVRVVLDPLQPPEGPVLVIETHGRLAMRRGIAEANTVLQRAGLQRAAPRVASAAPRWTTRLDSIRLSNDQEPWVSGSAEIYAIASGVVGDNEPELRIVDLPYLDDDGTTYLPQQIVLDWVNYEYQAANLQLFEHDDNTNYQQLVTALVVAVGEIGSLAGQPEIQAIAEIANRIIAAMPAAWFANDDDYVDSFYTIQRNLTYFGRIGAGGNATVTLQPFLLQPNE